MRGCYGESRSRAVFGGQEDNVSYGLWLAKGAGEGTPPFWIVVVALIAIVGVAYLVSKARKR
ncbi:putative protein OS=Streptomyces pilosus OX=28893 GN=GCM10010280_16780 PE=4 SV=1 [Streptomyces pilosus]